MHVKGSELLSAFRGITAGLERSAHQTKDTTVVQRGDQHLLCRMLIAIPTPHVLQYQPRGHAPGLFFRRAFFSRFCEHKEPRAHDWLTGKGTVKGGGIALRPPAKPLL